MKKKKREQPTKPLSRGCIFLFICLIVCGSIIYYILKPVLWGNFDRYAAARDCSNVPTDREPVVQTGIIEFDASDYATNTITENNANELEHVGTFYLNRDRFDTNPYNYDSLITHPNVDYVIYRHIFPSYGIYIAICGEENRALTVIQKGENHDDILFNQDGRLFALSDSYLREIRFFDANNLEELHQIDLLDAPRDIAFHPDLPLMAIVTWEREWIEPENVLVNYFLTIWNYETQTEIFRVELEEHHRNIHFNTEGTAIINYSSTPNTPVYIWGIPQSDE